MILFTASGALASAFSEQYSCKIISARLMRDQELSENIKIASVIIHNAALIVSDDLSKLVDDNFGLTKKLVDLSIRINPSVRFINISSMSFLKDEINYMDSSLMSSYAFSKYLAELYCLKQSHAICNVRFSTLFYANQKRDGLSNLAYDAVVKKQITIYNDGKAKRDFIPIDIATQYLHKLTGIDILPKIVNIVSGNSIGFDFFVEKIKAFNSNIKIINITSETPNVLCSFSKQDIEKLGEIGFSVEEYFENYILKLNESTNIQ